MAKRVRIEYAPNAITDFVKANRPIQDQLMNTGRAVAANAQATAQSAQNGPEGRLTGYAEAGFAVQFESRGKRPRVIIKSLADIKTALAAHFYTQKRDGVGHLRAALYKETTRGG
jgi:hypothetical protein